MPRFSDRQPELRLLLLACLALVIVTLASFIPSSAAQASGPLIVDSTADTSDANAGDGVCDDGTGSCTLRAALEEANALAGPDEIQFNISGAGVHTISPSSPLPYITESVVIDASTQPGANCSAWPAQPLIELNGAGAGPTTYGLWLLGGSSTVRGLIINRFSGAGIFLDTANNVIQCNYIGVDATGTSAAGNFFGVFVNGTTGSLIGGTTPGQGNVIGGNLAESIRLAGADGNIVQGNHLGVNPAGTAVIGGTNNHMLITGSNNTIGSTDPAGRNVIGGATFDGIYIAYISHGNVIQGNDIGVDTTGTVPLGNARHGIYISESASNNAIGGWHPERSTASPTTALARALRSTYRSQEGQLPAIRCAATVSIRMAAWASISKRWRHHRQRSR